MNYSCKVSLVVSSKAKHDGRKAKMTSICQFLVQCFLRLFSHNRIFRININIWRQFPHYQIVPICRKKIKKSTYFSVNKMVIIIIIIIIPFGQ